MAEKKPLTKNQIIAELAEKTNTSKKEAVTFVETFISLALTETKKVGKFTIPGLGILKLVNRPARMGRNPATGEAIKIAAKTVVKFTVAKAAKVEIAGAKK